MHKAMTSRSITWYICAVVLFLGVLPSNCQDHKDVNGTGTSHPAQHGNHTQTPTTSNNTVYLTVQHFEELSQELKDLSLSVKELKNLSQESLDWKRVLRAVGEVLLNVSFFCVGFLAGVRYYRYKCEKKDNAAVLTMRVPNFESGATLVMYMRPKAEGESSHIHIHHASSREITVVPLSVVPDPPTLTTAVPVPPSLTTAVPAPLSLTTVAVPVTVPAPVSTNTVSLAA